MLEPSAGLGHICQSARKLGVEPDCFEISVLLRRGLLLQGFNVIGDNFLMYINKKVLYSERLETLFFRSSFKNKVLNWKDLHPLSVPKRKQ